MEVIVISKEKIKLQLGNVTYGSETISKRIIDEYSALILKRFRELLFDLHIRTEHGLCNSNEEYIVKYENHILRLSSNELYDFIKEHNKLFYKKNFKNEKVNIDISLLNGLNNQKNELSL